MNDQPPIARLLKATVFFDTTVPRYFGAINEGAVLRAAFPRAMITTGVQRELELARPYVARAGGDLGPLLDAPCFAQVVEITDFRQIADVDRLRTANVRSVADLSKPTQDLGEFETVVAAQTKGGFPTVIEDSRGARVGVGRGLACYQAIHVCMIIAIRGLRSPKESWALYGRLLAAGLQPRMADRVGPAADVREDFLNIVDDALARLARTGSRR